MRVTVMAFNTSDVTHEVACVSTSGEIFPERLKGKMLPGLAAAQATTHAV